MFLEEFHSQRGPLPNFPDGMFKGKGAGSKANQARMESLEGELEILYDQHGTQFFQCALAVTHCQSMAEDAVHDAFQRAFQIKHFPDDLKAYVYRSVRNAAIDLVRKRSKSTSLPADDLFEVPATQLTALVFSAR